MMRLAVACTPLVLTAACATVPRQTKFEAATPGMEMSTVELRDRVDELGRREIALITDAVGRMRGATSDPSIRKAAVEWGLAAVPEVEEATLLREPLVAIGDLWAFALQTENLAREGPGRERFGETAVFVEQNAERMARECDELAILLFQDQAEKPRRRITRWAAEHPITSVTFARPTASVEWAEALNREQHAGLGSLVVSTNEQLEEFNRRVTLMNLDLVPRMRWTSEMVMQDALGREDVAALLRDGTQALASERRSVFREIARERDRILDRISAERGAARNDVLRLIGETNGMVHQDLEQQRAEIFAQVGEQRKVVISEFNRLLSDTDARVRGLVDHVLIGVALVGAFLIAVAVLAVRVLRDHLPPKPPRRLDAARPAGARSTG